jgi:4-aminobutyrate aminotransferase
MRRRIINRCFERGLLTLGCGRSTVRFMPPLMIGKDLVDEGLEIFERVVTEVENH